VFTELEEKVAKYKVSKLGVSVVRNDANGYYRNASPSLGRQYLMLRMTTMVKKVAVTMMLISERTAWGPWRYAGGIESLGTAQGIEKCIYRTYDV
jgi:hypothetical protein